MFSSGAGTSQQGSSVPPRPFFIPTRFIWPYGGRRVYLSGSFTRWTKAIPMSPMEGCPSVFQVVCNLTPGYHQYKFNVDGDWRHNVDQPFVTGNLGVVNTVFVAGQPDIVPSSFSPDTSMDVDNDDFTHMEVAPRISMADLELSRNRISVFLSRQTAYEMLPESGKVPALDVTVPVKEAFHILRDEQVPVIPLWDSDKGQFLGVLSALDFILILRELGNRGSNLTEEQMETYTIGEWKEGKFNLNRQLDRNGRCYPPHLISAGPHDSLKEVAVKIVQNKVATVPIIHTQSEAGSYPKLLYLATLSGILKCICRQFRHTSSSLPILQQPISEFHIGTWVPNIGESNGRPLAMVRPNTSLADTLSLMIQAEVSSVPIVDDNYSLLDVYSRCDITALAQYKAYTQIRLNQLTVHETLQYGRFANYPIGFLGGQRCQMCLRSDPLLKVMERLAITGVRRLVVVEAGSKRVEGIISLSDMFKFLLGLP